MAYNWRNIFSIWRLQSVQIISILLLYAISASYIPTVIQQGLYTLSLMIKEFLVWMIPITVLVYVAATIRSFEKHAPLFILLLLIFETSSNFCSIWYAYATANVSAKYLNDFNIVDSVNNFEALWKIPFSKPAWWSADKGAIAGLIIGRIAAYKRGNHADKFVDSGNLVVEWIITRFLGRLIPLFVLGFAVQMYQMKLLTHIFSHYAILVTWLLVFIVCYATCLFLLGAGGVLTKALFNARNILPAGAMALTSGCSISTMPLTIKCAAKNLQNPFLAKAIIPATTNIQQVGDVIANGFLCFLIYKNFNGHAPDILTWLNFSVIFVIARFATAAVLGGAIFIMIPIYEAYLGFTAEMVAILLALNVVLDPIITSSNVTMNAALCKIFENFWNMVQKSIESFKLKKVKSTRTI